MAQSTAQKILDEQELIRRLLARYTLKECAALFDVTYHTICRRARKPEFLTQLKELSNAVWAEVDQELKAANSMLSERVLELSSAALDRLEALLNGDTKDQRLVARIAMDFLDRNPETSKTTQVRAKVEHAFFNPKVLALAALAAQELDATTVGPTLDPYREDVIGE
jgi:hypothetical protein